MTEWKVRVGEHTTTAVFDNADGAEVGVLVCGHGAGGSLKDRGTLAAAQAMRAAGLGVVRFNFLYTEKGGSRPQPMPQLKECFAAVVERVRGEISPKRLILGGRSLGGRTASMLAADGFACDGVILLAYPLHPPGQTDKLRDAHLASIGVPVLCFNGTRDEFCEPGLMKRVVQKLDDNFTMHWVVGADHGFHVLKKSGRTDAEVMREITDATRSWLDQFESRVTRHE